MVLGGRRKKTCVGGSNPEWRVHEWYRWGDALGSLECIFMSWLRLASVPTGLSPYPTLRDTDGSAGSTRGPFSELGFHGVWGW